jgi:hypothetical protein
MAESLLPVKSVDAGYLRPSGYPWTEAVAAGYLRSRGSFVIVKGEMPSRCAMKT